MVIPPEKLWEWDTALITGKANDIDREFVDFHVMIATMSHKEMALKVWPMDSHDPQLPEPKLRYGKIWFDFENIKKVELKSRDYEIYGMDENGNPLPPSAAEDSENPSS